MTVSEAKQLVKTAAVQQDGTQWGVTAYFFTLFGPAALILLAIMFIVYGAEVRTEMTRMRLQESQAVNSTSSVLMRDLYDVVADIRFLAMQSNLRSFLAGGRPAARHDLEADFRVLCESKPAYDQLRYINADGREVVRVRLDLDRKAVTATWDELDNLAQNSDFIKSRLLSAGQVYISRLDPAERNKTLRFGIPVFSEQNRRLGVLLLDYRVQAMMERIGGHGLVDPEGNWLRGGKEEERRVTDLNVRQAFAETYPDAWNVLRKKEFGQETLRSGCFTWMTIYPFEIARQALAGRLATSEHAMGLESSYRWKLVSRVSPESQAMQLHSLRVGMVWFTAVILVLMGLAAAPYARLMARRREMHAKFREFAITDSLTQSYNRGFGMEMLDRLIAECKRLSARLCVFMIDVNNLKLVNDNNGHKDGDAYLRLVSDALKDGLREVDVVARYGGDEFMVILPFTMLNDGNVVLERVRESLNKMDTSRFEPYTVGFSFGGAEYDPQEDQPVSRLLDLADERMYEHKRRTKAGRTMTPPRKRVEGDAV